VLPVLGSPAALRALASSRVATFGSPAAPPECTVHHVLFALKDVLAATAPAPRLLSSPSCTSRARVWQRTELLLTDEFAEGEVERIWTADKRNTFAKIKHVWAQQFEQVSRHAPNSTVRVAETLGGAGHCSHRCVAVFVSRRCSPSSNVKAKCCATASSSESRCCMLLNVPIRFTRMKLKGFEQFVC
jgi:hypothetical protein